MIPLSNSTTSIRAQEWGRANGGEKAIAERICRCVERVSLEFTLWNEPHTHGPGLYFVLERDLATEYIEPMGANRWPVEDCTSVFDPLEALNETARKVASDCDGAVVVHSDGTIEEEMVRMKQLSTAEREQFDTLPYAGWMGARHMSALETSTREEICAVITLSEEDGRLTIFTDGTYEDASHDELGDK